MIAATVYPWERERAAIPRNEARFPAELAFDASSFYTEPTAASRQTKRTVVNPTRNCAPGETAKLPDPIVPVGCV